MAKVIDRWHLSRPGPGAAPCLEHKDKYRAAAHGTGLRWQLRYYDRDGIQRKENFRTWGAADVRRKVVERELDTDQFVPVVKGRRPFAEYANAWVGRFEPTTRELYSRLLRLHILPKAGSKHLGSINRGDASAWSTAWKKTLGPNLSRQCHVVAQAVFQAAEKEELIPRSPFREIKIPPIYSNGNRYFPEAVDECKAGMVVLPWELRTVQVIAFGCGLRLSEILALDERDIVWKPNPVLRVRRQLLYIKPRGKPRQMFLDDPKTMPGGARDVPLPAFVVEEIDTYLDARPAEPFKLPWGDPEEGDPFLVNAIFHHGGAPLLRNTVTNRIRYHLGQSGMPQGATPHVQRHMYESTLHDAGVPQIVIDTFMGHKPSGSMGRVQYQHVMRGAMERVRDVLDTAWNKADVPWMCPPGTSG